MTLLILNFRYLISWNRLPLSASSLFMSFSLPPPDRPRFVVGLALFEQKLLDDVASECALSTHPDLVPDTDVVIAFIFEIFSRWWPVTIVKQAFAFLGG